MSDPLLSSNDPLAASSSLMTSSGFGLAMIGSSERGPPSPPWDDDDDVLLDFDVEKSAASVDDFLSYSPSSLRLDSDTDDAITSFLKSTSEEKDVATLDGYMDVDVTLKKATNVMLWKDFCETTAASDDFVGDGVLCTTCNVTFASMDSVSHHVCDASDEGTSLSSTSSFDDHWNDFDVTTFSTSKTTQNDAIVFDEHFSVDSGVSLNDEDGSSLASFASSDDDIDSNAKLLCDVTMTPTTQIECDVSNPKELVSHCSVCKLVFSNSQKLEAHKKAFTSKVACCHCSKTFATVSKLRIHHRKHSKEKPFQCQCCQKYFMHRNTLVRHQQFHCIPLRGKLDDKVEEVIAEIELSKDGDQMAKMILEVIQNASPAIAEGKRKGEAEGAKTKAKIGSEASTTSCGICDSQFFDVQSLENHREYHLKQRSCCECHKVMVSKSKLLIHHRTHTKELPYACPVCDKSFAEKSTLTKHSATHGERNFRCDVCDKAFVRKDYLVKHSLTHRQTYKCSQCSFVCYNRLDIERHVTLHPPA